MNLECFEAKSEIPRRRLRELHESGLIHSPSQDGLWPVENLNILSRFSGNRKYIRRGEMRSSIIRACILEDRKSEMEVIEKVIVPSRCRYAGLIDVIKFTRNDNATATLNELVTTWLDRPNNQDAYYIPNHCIDKALTLFSNGYTPCWVYTDGGVVRTTIDVDESLTSTTPQGPEEALGVIPIVREVCDQLGIELKTHKSPKRPDALVTSRIGERWFEYAAFRNKETGRTDLELLGVLI